MLDRVTGCSSLAMSCRKTSFSAVAGRIGRALIFASKPSERWSPALEVTLRRLLLSLSTPLTPTLVSSVIDPHLLRHHSLAAGLFHFACQQPNFSPSSLSFHSLLKSSSSRSVLSLLKLAHGLRIPLLPSSITLAASALNAKGRTFEAAGLFMHSGTELPADLCNSLLAALSADGSLNIARQLFDEMLLRGVQFSAVGFGCFVGKLSRVEELKDTMLLVQKVKQQVSCQIDGSLIAALIVDGLCRAGRIDDAWEVLDQLRRIGCKPDFLAYRIVSEGFKSVCRLEETERILKQKRKLGVAPRVNVYGEFILSLISARRISEAKELAEAIVEGDFPMEDVVLNALIGSVSAVDIGSCIMFCKYMIRKDKVLSITSLKDLSKNLCKQGRDGEMWDIYQVFLGKEYFKGVEHYNVMVSFLCKAGKAREAYDILKEMKKKGFRPDICTYNFLFKALCRDDLLRPAKRLWDEIFTSGYCANLHTYNILIQKFLQVGESKEAHQLFNQMLRKGVAPDVVTYSSIMELLCKENRIAEALDVLYKCLEQDPTIASSTINALVDSLCKQGKYLSASHVMRGVPASIASCDSHLILLKSFAEAGEFALAIEYLDSIKKVSPMELENIVNKLLHSLSTTPNLGPVLQLLQAMQSHGVISHCRALMTLFDGSLKNII